MVAKGNKERAVIGLVLGLALLMFFAPLVSVHGAFAGDQSYNALNVSAQLTQLRSALQASSSAFSHGGGGSSGSASEKPEVTEQLSLPFALQTEWLATLLIFAALACAALALLDQLSIAKGTGKLCLAGALFGVLAILQLFAMNAGMRIWSSRLIESGMLGSSQDPFVSMRMLMARSFQLDPGIGLYVLTACLFMASALSYTNAIPRIQSVVRSSSRIRLAQPIRIRPVDTQYPEDNSMTVDVSKGGFYFESDMAYYYRGMEVRLRRNPDLSDATVPDERGSVVRVVALSSGKLGIAIRLIFPGAREHAL